MPSVGKKKFPYTRSGQKAARRYAKATGQPVSNSRGQGGVKYQHSPIPGRPGRVPKGRFGPKPRSLPPVPGRSAAPRKRRPQVGPGTGIGGGPRPLPKRPIGPGIAPPPSGIRGGNGDDIGILEYNKPPKGRRSGRKPGSGGSRVMRNPGMSGRSSKKGRGY